MACVCFCIMCVHKPTDTLKNIPLTVPMFVLYSE